MLPRFALLRRFCRETRGTVAVTFTLALIPILTFLGCAIDYSNANRIKAKLQGAADSAAVASVSVNSAAYNAAVLMLTDGSVPPGVSEATSIFNGNASTMVGYNSLASAVSVTKTGAKLSSSVQFSAVVPTTFLGVIGVRTMTVNGTSSANSSLPLYLDFYLMIDVSGSMGLPSTSGEQTRLAAINPDNTANYNGGCTFACHFAVPDGNCASWVQKFQTNGYCMGQPFSRVSQSALAHLISQPSTPLVPKAVPGLPNSMIPGLPGSLNTDLLSGLPAVSSCPNPGTDSCIQLRADAVGAAVNALFSYANTNAKIPNEYRIGLYPFIQYLYPYFPLTSAINGSASNPLTINYAAANLASLLDTNTNPNLGSGGTHIDNAFLGSGSYPGMNSIITSVGDGSSTLKTRPYVFLITDGAQNNQIKALYGGGWSGGSIATVINPTTVCGPLKNRGVTVSVLYIPYLTIQNPVASFAGNEDGIANNNIPNIPPSLQACASSGYFYTANTPADINSALQAMFVHAVTEAHLSN